MLANQLKPGMYIAIYAVKNVPYGMPEPSYDGTPMKIKSISHPFICVWNGHQTFGVDTREYVFVRVSTKFAKDMMELKPKKKKRKKQDPRLCPKCKEGILVERAVFEPGKDSKWVTVCPVCDNTTGDQVLRS